MAVTKTGKSLFKGLVKRDVNGGKSARTNVAPEVHANGLRLFQGFLDWGGFFFTDRVRSLRKKVRDFFQEVITHLYDKELVNFGNCLYFTSYK